MRIQLSTCQPLRATRPVRGSYHTHIRAARTEIYAIGREPRRSFIGRSTRADHGNEPANRTLHRLSFVLSQSFTLINIPFVLVSSDHKSSSILISRHLKTFALLWNLFREKYIKTWRGIFLSPFFTNSSLRSPRNQLRKI